MDTMQDSLLQGTMPQEWAFVAIGCSSRVRTAVRAASFLAGEAIAVAGDRPVRGRAAVAPEWWPLYDALYDAPGAPFSSELDEAEVEVLHCLHLLHERGEAGSGHPAEGGQGQEDRRENDDARV